MERTLRSNSKWINSVDPELFMSRRDYRLVEKHAHTQIFSPQKRGEKFLQRRNEEGLRNPCGARFFQLRKMLCGVINLVQSRFNYFAG